MNVTRTITVAWDFDGYHRWPAAEGVRSYLADRHRHRFHCTVTIPVTHDDRQVEFHDLLDYCRSLTPDGAGPVELNDASCERVAEHLATTVARRFEVSPVTAAVSEDGYVTGTVTVEQQP
jgi:hypothetical protein